MNQKRMHSQETQAVSGISDILLHRLREALQQGTEVRIRLANSSFYGVPIHLDSEFVELLCLYVDESDKSALCERAVWLIRLSEIVAFSYPITVFMFLDGY